MKYETEYIKLLDDALYEDAFLLLEKNINLVESKIEQRKQIREFLTIVNDKFDDILEEGRLVVFSSEFVHAFRDLPFLEESAKKLNTIFEPERVALMFSKLVSNNEFNNAKFLLPYFSKNIEAFPKTVNAVIDEKNTDGLRFLCENMDNTHYNNGEILRKSANMPVQTIISLVEDFDFDINETDINVRSSLMSEIVTSKNVRGFKGLVDKFGDSINWGQVFSTKAGTTIFDFIDATKIPLQFYSVLLAKDDLKQTYVERIGQTLFESDEMVKSASNTDVYDRFFSHPNFDHASFNLGQGYCLYGLLARMGLSASEDYKKPVAKAYVKIIDSFLNARTDDEMPQATNLHIVGAAVYVAKESQSQETVDACGLILRRYKHYVNKPNPDGKLPITQVEENSAIYRMLVNNGAITPKPPPGFWASVATSVGLMKRSNIEDEIRAQQLRDEEEVRNRQVKAPTNFGSLNAVKTEMRDNFREMRDTLSNHLCDPVIKMRCENMFLKSENLVTKMEKYKLTNSTEDVYFLSQTFSTYLSKSLKSYMKVCEAAVDFGRNETIDSKLEKAKKDCLEGIGLLEKQLDLIVNNVSSEVENSAQSGARVNRKFLENRLDNSDRLNDLEKSLDNLVSDSTPRAQETKASASVLDDDIDSKVVDVFNDNASRSSKKMKI